MDDESVHTCLAHDRHSVWIEQLTVTLSALSKLELEAALPVEYLYAVIVCVGYYYVVLSVDGHSARLGELPYNNEYRTRL